MRLKSVELKGFKSFADRTVINFSEDVIGIVGSNGCGKSNIVDAVRWVLGEQKTRQLRSDSMTSVIFNGTNGRNSSGLAEVNLVFINDKGILPIEFSEVSIKRSLFRDGNSEYMLNGVKCRLKDITNLLADTGMGPDSYAIIALGMVDDLLQDKENSRIRLFEQAAGISKFKTRKKETFNKLKATETDLDRVEDILYELDKNLKSLEKQANRAKRYFELKTEYKRLSLELSYFKIKDCKDRYKKINEQLESERMNKHKLSNESTAVEREIEAHRSRNIDKEEALNGAQKKLNQTIAKIKNKENDRKILSQKTIFLEQNNEAIDLRLNELDQKIIQLDEKKASLEEKIIEEEKLLLNSESDLNQKKTKLDLIFAAHDELKLTMDVHVKEQKELNLKIFSTEKNIAVLLNKEESLQSNLLVQNNKQIQLINAQEHFELEKEQLDEELKIVSNQLEALLNAEKIRKEKILKTEQSIEERRILLSEQHRTLDAKIAEEQLLSSMVANLEGYTSSIKFLSKNDEWTEAPTLLSDVFYCDPIYRAAIEHYLDNFLNYFVVDNVQEATKAIKLLAHHQKGKANFILLDRIQAPKKTQVVVDGIRAIDIIQFDSKYEALASFLFSNVLIVDQIDQTEQDHIVYLYKDGSLSMSQSVMKGGFVGAFEGKKIGRKKNLERLSETIKKLKIKTDALENALNESVKELHQLKAQDKEVERIALESVLNSKKQQFLILQKEQENTEKQQDQIQNEIKLIEAEIVVLTEKVFEERARLEKLQKEAAVIQIQAQEKDQSYQQQLTQLNNAQQSYNAVKLEMIRQKNTVDYLYRDKENLIERKQEYILQKQKDQQILKDSGGDLSSTVLEIQQIKTLLENLYIQKKEEQEALSASEKAFFLARNEIVDKEKLLRDTQRKYTQCIELIASLDNAFNQVKLELTSIADKLNMEFDIRINDLTNETPNPDFDEAVLESNVEQLRDRIYNYGPINPMAIEAYDEIKDRHKTISDQRADLLESKENLLQTIKEIETKATEKFMDAFEKVRAYFQEVFRSLFHEDDTCDLLLVDPKNPLDSAIEIVAKPKGKKPLSINQLSGGEKTLTATALLFALYLLKPAPFCIFDEVDAPLDDANIGKFNKIIKKFSKNSQFIIVTHNKKTMESVDVMYGITMVKGVSRVVPVDFRAFETMN